MICPDCGKEIGRFQAGTDPTGKTGVGEEESKVNRAEFNAMSCPQTGRKVLPETAPPGRKVPGLKKYKKKKNVQTLREKKEENVQIV